MEGFASGITTTHRERNVKADDHGVDGFRITSRQFLDESPRLNLHRDFQELLTTIQHLPTELDNDGIIRPPNWTKEHPNPSRKPRNTDFLITAQQHGQEARRKPHSIQIVHSSGRIDERNDNKPEVLVELNEQNDQGADSYPSDDEDQSDSEDYKPSDDSSRSHDGHDYRSQKE